MFLSTAALDEGLEMLASDDVIQSITGGVVDQCAYLAFIAV